jgi:protein-disulfide isomerase
MRAALALAAVMLPLILAIGAGWTAPVFAAEPTLAVFGEGSVEVRVYTDYFCGPCGAEEKELTAAITELVAKKRIRVFFIDTPLHPETVLYARYFLAALNAKRELRQAVAARAALFEAAGQNIKDKGPLEAFLAKKGVALRSADFGPVFGQYDKYLKEDRINSTPTVVIVGPQGKQTLIGKEPILKALGDLSK